MLEVLQIRQRRKASPVTVASLDDFSVIPNGHADPDLLVRDPTISLYCLDDAGKRAIFVETPAGVDITAHPFLYQAQYEHAQRLVAVSYATLVAVAAALPAARVPLVLIYSPGRSGSTLLSKAFQEVGAVASLSEPDVYTQIVALREQDRSRDAELTDLLAAATKLLFKPSITGQAILWVAKFRGFAIEVADLLQAAFLDARSIFLYRDLRTWTRSMLRSAPGVIDTGTVAGIFAPYAPLLAAAVRERGPQSLALVEVTTLMWLSAVHWYVDLCRQGMVMHALRYDDMVANPRTTLATVFRYTGLGTAAVDAAVRAFDRDSQEGSVMSRAAIDQRGAADVSEAEWAKVRVLLRQYPLPVVGSIDGGALVASALV
jgi:hypothetical protein